MKNLAEIELKIIFCIKNSVDNKLTFQIVLYRYEEGHRGYTH